MAESPALTPEQLKEAYLKDKAKFYPFVSRLEEPAEKDFTAKIDIGNKVVRIHYRKLKHGEVDYLVRLPFYYKLMDREQKLTDGEQMQFDALRTELVSLAVLPESKPLWESLSSDPRVVDALWNVVSYSSGIDSSFSKALDEFLTDDLGFSYGAIWIGFLHRTPSEMALLTESDVAFVNAWYDKWNKRMGKTT